MSEGVKEQFPPSVKTGIDSIARHIARPIRGCATDGQYEDVLTRAADALTVAAETLVRASWQPIETAPPYKTLLTIHEDDLYPVCAFYVEQDGERHWVRVIEGPEDVIRTEDGDHGSLYRPPTHWILPPDPPTEEAKNGQA